MSIQQDKSLMSELQQVGDTVQRTYHRISMIEKKLAQKGSIENRDSLESQLETAKNILKENEEKLLKLRKSNSKSFMIAACLIFFIFLMYGLYSMIFNPY